MATKVEEANIAPVGNAGLVDGTSSEKQTEAPATASAVESTEKKVETTTEGLNDLSLAEKGETSQPSKEEPAKEEALKEEPAKEVAAPASSGEATTVAPANPPTTSATEPTSTLSWPETSPEHPLTKFYDSFEELVTKASHNEVYGIELSKSSPFHTKLILQKFLRANQNDLEKAKQQLLETLEWRKTFNPTKAATESFDKSRFGGLGYALEVEGVPESTNKKDIVTFNIYGAVKDKKATFGDLESFLRWRVGLMEKSVLKLNLKDATAPIPNFGEGPDPYQGFQIHDYLQVSFIRQDPHVKAATSETIKVLGRYYPETLSRKFFVNVPVVMGWVYQAVKMVVAKETAKKFTVLSYGNQLATELGPNVPKVYGGNKGELEEVGEAMTFSE